ncbi:valine--tRNA ligase, partial [Candidatus Woesearchaeota archaeon]|nr:valine--tRNA ligase [Candidatus Woesearchaeota archaeon]
MNDYEPREAEVRWLTHWEQHKIFAFDPDKKGAIFSIDIPPPTFSGKMHIGHAFSYSQQDIIARYQRMRGKNVFFPFGTDDNGLPTERLVEKTKGVKGSKMERQAFIKLCETTLKESLPEFIFSWKRIGISCDFNYTYSTISDHARRIAQWSFLDLHKKGRAYRKEAPALWCPQCATAISQVECQDVEKASTFNDIIFKVDGKDVVIATTRPELLPACVAVFAHPNDDRYKKLIGKQATVPLFNVQVPIKSDERVDPTKGTGIVMCCTFGDQTDIAWYLAYNLPLKQAISPFGKMTPLAGAYEGKNIHDTRKAVLADLKTAGLLVGQKPISHAVKVHERCQTEIEIVNSKQWFIKYLDLRDDMLQWGAEVTWHPAFMKHRLDNWIKGLQWDWLISRQRFFGVPFPVWYCTKCQHEILADEKKLPVDPLKDQAPVNACPKCKSTELVAEKDVLDTWFTSSMTPQIATQLLPAAAQKRAFPMSIRPQAHEIISFWLFNSLVKSRLHYGVNPWKEALISGLVMDPLGEKMSKSKGNTIEPSVLIDKFSGDALRFWAGSAKLGEDVAFQEKELVTGKKFVTKLWNAVKFLSVHLEQFHPEKAKEATAPVDQWILDKLAKCVEESTSAMETYAYPQARASLMQFFWHDFCDNYLE